MEEEEFFHLLSGISSETPLGQIVNIRCEDDRETLKHFTPEQHKIRNEWRNKLSNIKLNEEQQKNRDRDLCKQVDNFFKQFGIKKSN